jgi:RNA polymerase sigma factor (sigma-70 family)
MMTNCLPQHLQNQNAMDECNVIINNDCSSHKKSRRNSTMMMTTIIVTLSSLSIVSSITVATAFSAPATPSLLDNNLSAARSLVDQARMIRELKINGGGAATVTSTPQSNLDALQPALDNDAWSAALFDESFTNGSLEMAVAAASSSVESNERSSSATTTTTSISNKQLAEQYDRFMEEDISVSSIIHDNLKPGSLVDNVKNSKGPDVDMELLLQDEARKRRARAELMEETTVGLTKVLVTDRQQQQRAKAKSVTVPKSKKSKSPSSSSSANNKSDLLTRDQEYELARTIQKGVQLHKLKAEYEATHQEPLSKRDWAQLAGLTSAELRRAVSDYRTAKQQLVSSNMGLVHAVVNNQYRRKAFKHHRGQATMDELVQEGSLGLIRAAELFDPEKGLRFSTYATIWIKGVLSNVNLDDSIVTVSSRERIIWNKIRRGWDDMKEAGNNGGNDATPSSEQQLQVAKKGRGKKKKVSTSSQTSVDELANQLGMKKERVQESIRRMQCVGNVLSLDYQYTTSTRSGSADGRKQEALMSTKFFSEDADLAERAQLKADLVAGLVRNLDERELELIRLRYGLHDGQEYTIKECAAKMGINRETARLLQHACLKKLREASNMESLQEYLLTVA